MAEVKVIIAGRLFSSISNGAHWMHYSKDAAHIRWVKEEMKKCPDKTKTKANLIALIRRRCDAYEHAHGNTEFQSGPWEKDWCWVVEQEGCGWDPQLTAIDMLSYKGSWH